MPTPPQDRTRRSCVCHCSECDSCFSGEEAFDLHRRGDYETGRWCEEPEDATHKTRDDRTVRSFEVAQASGRCEIGWGEPRVGVTIWRKARVSTSEGAVAPAPPLREAA